MALHSYGPYSYGLHTASEASADEAVEHLVLGEPVLDLDEAAAAGIVQRRRLRVGLDLHGAITICIWAMTIQAITIWGHNYIGHNYVGAGVFGSVWTYMGP